MKKAKNIFILLTIGFVVASIVINYNSDNLFLDINRFNLKSMFFMFIITAIYGGVTLKKNFFKVGEVATDTDKRGMAITNLVSPFIMSIAYLIVTVISGIIVLIL